MGQLLFKVIASRLKSEMMMKISTLSMMGSTYQEQLRKKMMTGKPMSPLSRRLIVRGVHPRSSQRMPTSLSMPTQSSARRANDLKK